MSRSILLILFTRRLGVAAVAICFACIGMAEELHFAPSQVIVEFQPGAVELPTNPEARVIPIGQVPFGQEGLGTYLQQQGILSFRILGDFWRSVDPDPEPPEGHVAPQLASFRHVYVLQFSTEHDLDTVVENLEELPAIVFVARDPLLQLADGHWPVDTLLTCPGDSCGRNYQWNLKNTGGDINDVECLEGLDIGMERAWSIQDLCSVKIAIADTGVDSDHPDLEANIDTLLARNYAGYDPDTTAWEDTDGHGTASAGIVAALHSRDSLGVAGICGKKAWNHQVLVPIRIVAESAPDSADRAASSLIDALSHCCRNFSDIPVLVFEIVIPYNSTDSDDTISKPYIKLLRKAVWNAYTTGVFLVSPAGNDPGPGNVLIYPAGYDKTSFGVTAIGCDGSREQGFWGGTNTTQNAYWIDLCAPGSADHPTYDYGKNQIVTTKLGGGFKLSNVDLFCCTSAAVPHVGGAAGLLLSHTSALTNEDTEQLLIRTAQDVDTLSGGGDCGHGLLRVDSSLVLLDSLVFVHDSTSTIDSYTLVDSCVLRKFSNILLADETAAAPEFDDSGVNVKVKCYQFETTVDLSENTNSNNDDPMVWVRGRQSLSARRLANYSDRYDGYAEPFYGDVVSATATTATLRGWTYQLWSRLGGCEGGAGDTLYGWFPLRLPVSGSPRVFSFSYLADTTSTDRFPRSHDAVGSLQIRDPILHSEQGELHIKFSSPVSGAARLKIYDLNGRLTRQLALPKGPSGPREFIWDGHDDRGHQVPAGVYFGHAEVADYAGKVRLVLMR